MKPRIIPTAHPVNGGSKEFNVIYPDGRRFWVSLNWHRDEWECLRQLIKFNADRENGKMAQGVIWG